METIDYWNQFQRSGSVADYLVYRGVDACSQAFSRADGGEFSKKRAGERQSGGFGHGYGYGAVAGSGGRI